MRAFFIFGYTVMLMKSKRGLVFALLLIAAFLSVSVLYFDLKKEGGGSAVDLDQAAQDQGLKKKEIVPLQSTASAEDDGVLDGVNPIFFDRPELQAGWIDRAKSIVLKNSLSADSADFRGVYFHRGFSNRPVTCGEVQLSKGSKVLVDYQRFIYAGLTTAYFENDIKNFDIFWEKMCVQFSRE